MIPKMLELLRASSPVERELIASECDTTVGYLYQLATPSGSCPNIILAYQIEKATSMINNINPKVPVVTMLDIVTEYLAHAH